MWLLILSVFNIISPFISTHRAVMVEFEDGRKKTLSMLSESKRKAVANQLLTSSVAASGAGNDGNVNKEKKVLIL